MKDKSDFNVRAYLLSISDREERARIIHENGWSGLPEIEDIERLTANRCGRSYQSLLGAFQPRPKPTPKRELARMKRRVEAMEYCWRQRLEKTKGKGWVSPKAVPAPPSTTVVDAPLEVAEAVPPDLEREASSEVPKCDTPPQQVLIQAQRDRPKPGSPEEQLARYVYENQRKLWPHLKGEVIPRPEWYTPPEPAPATPLAFGPPRPAKTARSSDLTATQVAKVYDAIAFAMWQHGALMSAHVVILWETLGIRDHEVATKLLSEYLNQAKKWAAVGKPGSPRQRRRERAGEGFDFRYVYVHENATQRGFHTHILCTVPRDAAKAFEAWSKTALARLTRRKVCAYRAVRVIAPKVRDEQAGVKRGWNWFRYICKQLDQNAGWGAKDERWRSLREILKVWPYRVALPVTCAQLVGGSQDIWTKAQKDAEFVSKLWSRDYRDNLYNGDEMDEWRRRLAASEMLRGLNLGS